eukprot:IDg19630t1
MPGLLFANTAALRNLAIGFSAFHCLQLPLYGCVGALDGIAISLQNSSDQYIPRNFYCRKRKYTLSVQSVVDCKYRFILQMCRQQERIYLFRNIFFRHPPPRARHSPVLLAVRRRCLSVLRVSRFLQILSQLIYKLVDTLSIVSADMHLHSFSIVVSDVAEFPPLHCPKQDRSLLSTLGGSPQRTSERHSHAQAAAAVI